MVHIVPFCSLKRTDSSYACDVIFQSVLRCQHRVSEDGMQLIAERAIERELPLDREF
jgi:hypothetical protein